MRELLLPVGWNQKHTLVGEQLEALPLPKQDAATAAAETGRCH